MQNLITIAGMRLITGFASLLLIAGLDGCNKKNNNTAPPPPTPASLQSFSTVNLVASDATFTGARVDPHLINGWGIAFSGSGTAWISSPGDHTSVIYNSTGAQVLAPVSIPTH